MHMLTVVISHILKLHVPLLFITWLFLNSLLLLYNNEYLVCILTLNTVYELSAVALSNSKACNLKLVFKNNVTGTGYTGFFLMKTSL